MTVSVLVVDDSGFFRRRVCEILDSVSTIKVVGTASNGQEALELVKKLKPDVVTMDYEMPVMNGVAAVKQIMREAPTPVLMFSSLTYEGARVTLDALDAGAVDFLPKNFEDIARDSSHMQEVLKQRILAVAATNKSRSSVSEVTTRETNIAPAAKSSTHSPSPSTVNRSTADSATTNRIPIAERVKNRLKRPTVVPKSGAKLQGHQAATANERVDEKASSVSNSKIPHQVSLVAIGTSTGGPIALQKILTKLPGNFAKPILLIQHMPASFTQAFAERLNRQCQITVKQAEDGDLLKPGLALLAPGGKQMIIESRSGSARVKILEGDERLHYKPCVDVTFGSAARCFPGKTLGIILTGMGADGKDGCRLMKQTGSTVWAQDRKSSVIYGMPMAVVKAGLADEILSLDDVAGRIVAGLK
ncbi:protein-glutamate methylesterase/protein-glutamine glutaminase [Alkalimarinus sediminis]|uniref:Protein-glutamate methylesterase/protein-glutamine glutaminase n=1 Tax=Alkalimarinus sediminis TaxID=1632866 RepID=A0A9E8KR87_9ALTE|nr:chemotaxis response regulator protein-glutamate methylesterase [Alkalimarinus sediminis]UZW76729.1 chemotaxis response regulator protein-glutamate methylesterase [Alkalimarinus sediminis]